MIRTRQGHGEIIGGCPAMRRVYRQISKAARYEVPVLIVGETGTGKDLVAREIHRASNRADKIYNPVNMGAVPRDLVAGTLFGHEKGAFTGAVGRKQGMFELTDGGTLFLDEIGTMDEQTQISLLRVLEDGKVTRVGGATEITCDVRLIGATNMELIEAVRDGSFREDLYYRLNVFTIRIPPLRKRKGDILQLADHFLERYNREFAKEVESISDEAKKLLSSYLWPGNVREMENVIIQAVISAEGNEITSDLLKPAVTEATEEDSEVTMEVGMTLEEAERQLIERTLEEVEGKRSEAARLLGISRKGFYNKLKKYDLQRSGEGEA